MKNSRCLLSAVLFTFLFFFSNAQTFTARTNTISGNCGGYYEYLPQGYSSNTGQSYPLIVAVHGIGELGNGTSDLPNLLNCWTSIPRLIANGGFPSSFNVGGQNFSFIVICPQYKAWPYASDVNDVVNYAIQNYRVDQSRIYVTGLSMGGGAVWDFAGNYPTKAAAVVPVCGAASSDPTRAGAIANAKLPVWATHNQNDPTVSVSNTTGWVNLINQLGGNAMATIFNASGHDAWTQTYDPNFTQNANGENIYQWMLQHQKGSTSTPPPTTSTNQPPTANAGANQTITLPTNSVTLNGSGTDPDGTINFYQWNQTSGPSQASFSSLYSAKPVVSSLVQGSYVFTLKVTDNLGATATSSVTITVNAAINQPPSANAGQDQTITLPQDSITVSGSGTDSDGSIAAYQWSEVSGPSSATIASPSTAITLIKNLVQGAYTFSLKVTDNNGASAVSNITITVNAAPLTNQIPTANAGSDQTIDLPQTSVTLSGSGTDSDGSISAYQWSQTSGPSQANIVAPNSASTSVNGLTEGKYVFTLKVTDDKGATAASTVTITVNAAPNQPPVANAGTNQTITLPQNNVTLNGSGTDNDGSIVSYQWSQSSGPAQSNITAPSSATTSVNNLIEGTYIFSLKVTDDKGATATANVTIKVNPAPNQPPLANAGQNQIVTLPVNSVSLKGSGYDSDGTISSYQWSQTSGPSQATIASAGSANTIANNLTQGIYVFTLTVTDNKGATAKSNVTVTVNNPPTANAGIDETITLPESSTTLTGSASDLDGTIASYQWSQISGPSKANIVNGSSATANIKNLIQGIYSFRLTVIDNSGATAWDEMTITVLPDPSQKSTASLYPNPANDFVYVKIDAVTPSSNTQLQIINSAGNIVYTQNFVRTDFRQVKQVDVSKLAKGIYFLTVTTDINTKATLTLIKQ